MYVYIPSLCVPAAISLNRAPLGFIARLPQWILSSAGAYLPAQASSYRLRVLTCRGGAATLHAKVCFTIVFVVVLFHFDTTLLTFILSAWSLTNKVLLCRCYAYRCYHNLLAPTLLYNTLSRPSVVCILCYTRFEPRVHSHHPRRGSLTARYSGLCPFILQRDL